MLRRSFAFVPMTAGASAAQYRFNSEASKGKMETLHKIPTGEVAFKDNAPVKDCYVETQFGADWKKELEVYAKNLKADEKAILERQVSRLTLTKYTTRELAQFAGDGPAAVEGAAQGANICAGLGFLNAKGESEFTTYVKEEGARNNWTVEQVTKFVDSVKAAKKTA
eukprot:286056_1